MSIAMCGMACREGGPGYRFAHSGLRLLRHACTLLLKYLGARAPTEALLHAFFAERDLDRASAQFWIEAYQLIVGTRK
jgi:hypothetical protein